MSSFPRHGSIEAFAMLVDINGFTTIVDRSLGENIAKHISDVLKHGVNAVESHQGHVVGFMGDAFLAILHSRSDVIKSCTEIAQAVAEQCQIVKDPNTTFKWPLPEGPSLKIAVEYGWMDISGISSHAIGEQIQLIGPPINYANRISSSGSGNRCHIGPNAAQLIGVDCEELTGPYRVEGKKGEGIYTYYRLPLDRIWEEDPVSAP
jgi:class 3 adenylate cyclase